MVTGVLACRGASDALSVFARQQQLLQPRLAARVKAGCKQSGCARCLRRRVLFRVAVGTAAAVVLGSACLSAACAKDCKEAVSDAEVQENQHTSCTSLPTWPHFSQRLQRLNRPSSSVDDPLGDRELGGRRTDARVVSVSRLHAQLRDRGKKTRRKHVLTPRQHHAVSFNTAMWGSELARNRTPPVVPCDVMPHGLGKACSARRSRAVCPWCASLCTCVGGCAGMTEQNRVLLKIEKTSGSASSQCNSEVPLCSPQVLVLSSGPRALLGTVSLEL